MPERKASAPQRHDEARVALLKLIRELLSSPQYRCVWLGAEGQDRELNWSRVGRYMDDWARRRRPSVPPTWETRIHDRFSKSNASPSLWDLDTLADAFDMPAADRRLLHDAHAAVEAAKSGPPEPVATSAATGVLDGLFHAFFTDPNLARIRASFEHRYTTDIDPIIQAHLRGHDAQVVMSGPFAEREVWMVNLLNILEYGQVCADHGLIDQQLLDRALGWWLHEWLRAPAYAAVLVYLPLWGYGHLSKWYGVDQADALRELRTVAVYGTLRAGDRNASLLEGGQPLGSAEVRGRLYEVSPDAQAAGADYPYPALVDGDGSVTVDVYRFDPADAAGALTDLDALEEFDPDDPDSEYERRYVALHRFQPDAALSPGDEPLGAWVYFYRRPVEGFRRIDGGDWDGPDSGS